MNIERSLTSDHEFAAGRLVEQAALISRQSDPNLPASFVAALFGRSAVEDIKPYTPHELATLGLATFAHFALRKSGLPDIRVTNPAKVGDDDRLSTISVVEIVNDDMPFLVDSVMDELTSQGINVHLVAHPVLVVERDASGRLLGAPAAPDAGARGARESLIHIHIDRLADQERGAALTARLAEILAEVRAAVDDWQPMQARIREALVELTDNPPPLPAEEISEAKAFVEWLLDDQFTFLGCRDYAVEESAEGPKITPQEDTGLGLLRASAQRLFHRLGTPLVTGPHLSAFLREPALLIVSKSNVLSRVHRRVWMDVVSLKRFDPQGRLVGELRIAGLFTSVAYTRASSTIPYLRRKAARVLTRAGFASGSHSGKALVNVLDSYPRDDLFQIEEEELFHNAMTILQLDERPRLRVLARRERFDRYVSVLCFIPRDRYDSTVRERIGAYLATAFGGRVAEFRPFFLKSSLTRAHFIVERVREKAPNPDRAELEAAIGTIVRTWGDGLAEALQLVYSPERANALRARYAGAFPAGYRDAYAPQEALSDLRLIQKLDDRMPIAAQFHAAGGGEGATRSRVALKVLSFGRPRPLSERVPLVEAMGFTVVDERTFTVEPEGTPIIFVHDMVLARRNGGAIALDQLESRLHACLMAVLAGEAESDGFNALVLNAGLPWREVALLRTLGRFLRQVGTPYSQDYLWATLNAHPTIAADLVALFTARFDPAATKARDESQAEVRRRIETALGEVPSLDEDRILRAFANLIEASVRTSFYQRDAQGRPRPTIAVKFASGQIDGLPLPRPLFEIFVHSPRVEGVHLRFGRVARGGLRWSDRPQDFRTEVLGLVKAQQVKNAVIVPVGAKGGFVPKHLPAGPREAIQEEGIAAYKLFVGSLLDLTDNIEDNAIVHPAHTVRHDEDDPYLVVAADKGTATFSDIANGLSQERGFWLGDAFASGGSVGYDHKAMGITARGAWEAVRRHFREMDVDIRTTSFTVAGVGDMSGDVFGNGMMLENTIRLIAAFDHRDIFLDPTPDPIASLAERQRLFALPRSSWQDYDKTLISKGGGVFPRSAKSIALSTEMRAALGIDKASLSPAELMSAILKSPVDLLWFGGIGTYIRSSVETDAQAGDKANDAIRITGAEVRAKVIGEGANLGVTQRGRIEAARRGVRLNTDAIDNSAGVNTSDVEVNIKIALVPATRDGQLDADSRARFLAGMTDDVAQLVLRNNYLQTLALSLAQRHGANEIGFHQRLMQQLEARGLLDRAVEFLPSDAEIAERRGRGEALTRPELAVLLAYAKLTLHADLLETEVPDDPYLSDELSDYFPAALREHFPDGIEHHRLRRDIIATRLSNAILNHGGPAFVARLADGTGADAASIAKAFAVTYDSFRLGAIISEIDALDAKVPGAVQLELYAAVETLLRQRAVWFLRNVDLRAGLGELVAHYAAAIEPVAEVLRGVVRELLPEETRASYDAHINHWTQAGVPEDLARRIARLSAIESATDIVMIADRSKAPLPDAAETFFAVGLHFRLDRLLGQAASIDAPDYYDRLALERALASFEIAIRRLTTEVLAHHGAGAAGVAAWAKARGAAVERARTAMHEIAGSGLTVSKLSVAASLLGDLVTG